MIDSTDKLNIQKMIDVSVAKSMEYQTRKRGDTPTDALHLTPKKYVDSRIIGGLVISDGTKGTPFPTGWTSSRSGTGTYVITHNLNTTNYIVTANSATTTTASIQIVTVASNSFTMTARAPLADNLVDTDISFHLVYL